MAEIKYEVVQRVAVLSQRPRGWERQLNLISWNDGETSATGPRMAPAWARAFP